MVPDPQVASPAPQAFRQLPLEHTVPAGQRLPQPPQWSKLFERFTQYPPQSVKGLAQAVTQVPPLQSGVAPGQMWPQLPQLEGSSTRMVQTWLPWPPQWVKLPWQVQAPAEQAWYGPQAVPQAPQFAGSVCRLVQAVPHRSGVAPPQPTVLATHAPEEQSWPAGQAVPQAPQFAGSVCTSVQNETEPTVQVFGVLPAQVVAQTPPVHTSPAGQVSPQLPQFRTSLRTSTQRPEQFTLG